MLGVSRASAGEMLKRLEGDGLVERGEHKEAILTPKGRLVAERCAATGSSSGSSPTSWATRRRRRTSRPICSATRSPTRWSSESRGAWATWTAVRTAGRSTRISSNARTASLPLDDLEPGSRAEIVRLAEHDGSLLHWYYDEGLVPGTQVELREIGDGRFVLRERIRARARRTRGRRPLRQAALGGRFMDRDGPKAERAEQASSISRVLSSARAPIPDPCLAASPILSSARL